MPVEIGRSVCGHLISKTAMGPSLLTSFAKVTSQSAIWRVERLVAIMDKSSVRSVTFGQCCTQESLYLDEPDEQTALAAETLAVWRDHGASGPNVRLPLGE